MGHAKHTNGVAPSELRYNEQMPAEAYTEGLSAVHMHVDTDLHLEHNQDFADGRYDDMESSYLDAVMDFMAANLGVDRAAIHVYTLDATRPGTKISRHYIFRIDGCMFASNRECGALKRHFQQYVHDKFGEPGNPDNNWYFRNRKNDSWEFWMDSIYTTRRSFRMVGNTKAGEVRPLLPKDVSAQELAAWTDQQRWKYCILVPDPPPAKDAVLRLLVVPEVGGGVARSQRVSVSRFLKPKPALLKHHQFVKAQNAVVAEDEDDTAQNIYVPEDWDARCNTEGIKWMNKNQQWGFRNRMSGRSRTPRVCHTLGNILLEYMQRTTDKQWKVTKDAGLLYYDFNVRGLRFSYVTKGNNCGVLYERTKRNRYKHNGQNSIIMVDLRTRRFWWECYNQHCQRFYATRYSLDDDAVFSGVDPKTVKKLWADIDALLRVFSDDLVIDLYDVAASLLFSCTPRSQ
jgi:hypothetical protein